MRYKLSVLLLLIAFTACSANSNNMNARLLKPVPDHPLLPLQIRVIGEKSTERHCIDDPETAVCTVENFITCWINTPSHACGNRPVTIIHDMAAWATLGHADSIEYSIVSVHRFNTGDLERKRPRAHRFPAGSVEVVLKQRLTPGRQDPSRWRTGYYILVPDKDEWQILTYFSTPWPDPRITERRWMSQGESSSNCIGDTSDPLCSIETLVACWLRRDGALCRKVIDCEEGKIEAALCQLPSDRMPRLSPALPWPRYSLEYYVIVSREPTRTDFGPPGAPLMEVWMEQFFLGPEGDRYTLVPEYDLPGLLTAPGPGYWVAFVDGQWLVTYWGGELGDY